MKLKCTLAALVATALAANAATVVVSTTRGASGDQANLNQQGGQTFTTGVLGSDTLLSTIDLVGPNTAGGSDPVGPFTVKIWTDVDGDATTWDPGTQVAASTGTVTIPAANATVTANFTSGVLSDNTVYVLSFTDGAGDHTTFRMGLTLPDNPLGTTGKLFHAGGDPGFGDNRELAFTVTTVPEPSSAFLLGLGGLALLRRRRR